MNIKRLFIFVFLVLFGYFGFAEAQKYPRCTSGCHECLMNEKQWLWEMHEIDWALHQLYGLQRQYHSQAIIHLDEGIRWQFMNGQFTESRRALSEAELEKQQVEVIQMKIKHLKNRREYLLQCRR